MNETSLIIYLSPDERTAIGQLRGPAEAWNGWVSTHAILWGNGQVKAVGPAITTEVGYGAELVKDLRGLTKLEFDEKTFEILQRLAGRVERAFLAFAVADEQESTDDPA